MTFLFFFQDFVAVWSKIADQGIAISVLALICVFVYVIVRKMLPSWERVKTAEAEGIKAQAKALGELASSQNQLTGVIQNIVVEQRQSFEAVKILQRVNAKSNENLAAQMQDFSSNLQEFNERIARLENKDAGTKQN